MDKKIPKLIFKSWIYWLPADILSVGSRNYEVVLEKNLFLESLIFLERKILFLESFQGYRWAANGLNESPESFRLSRNKHFVHN
jgi:hypothetical protein